MTNKHYTLADYFIAAGLREIPVWFRKVRLRHKPWAHQVDDLRFCLQYERFGLFNDAGVGKTLSMQAMLILYCCAYKNKGVVCMPPSLIGQFMESLFHPEEAYFIGLSKYVDIKAYSGTKKKKDKLMLEWANIKFPDVIVMSYNAFSDMHPTKARKAKTITNKRTGKSYLRPEVKPLRHHPLKSFGVSVLFFDEAQALKNITSGISKKVFKYVGNTKGEYLLGLFTGSPIANELIDALGMLKLITPEVYPTKRSFERMHCIYAKNSDFPLLLGYKNEDILHKLLYKQARRVTKQQVMKDLPPMLPEAIPVELSATHRHWYNKLLTERVLELDSEFIDATQDQKLRQLALQIITNPDSILDVKVDNEVYNTFKVKLDGINPKKNKVIIFSYFKETVDMLKERLAEFNPATLNGATGNKEAEKNKFLRDDTCRIFIVNWLSGGAGLNLQISNHIIFYEQPTVPSDAIQAIARSHRGGQDKPVNVTFFKVVGTLMARSLKKLLKKDHTVNKVIRDKHKMLHELLGGDG